MRLLPTARHWCQSACLPLLDLLYPPLCPGCGNTLTKGKGLARPALCNRCMDSIPRLTPPFCQRCAQSHDGYLPTPYTCANCKGIKFHFETVITPFKASGILREILHKYKFEGRPDLRATVSTLVEAVWDDPRTNPILSLPEQWAIVPVPLHPKRQRWRGFNQADDLARALARHSGCPRIPALRRTTDTKQQSRLSRNQRIHNMRNAFNLSNHRKTPDIQGRNILLIDDVVTTGSTTNACAKILIKKAKARKVVVIALARG